MTKYKCTLRRSFDENLTNAAPAVSTPRFERLLDLQRHSMRTGQRARQKKGRALEKFAIFLFESI